MRSQNIFLVGPMGAGKTTIGRQLAQSLGKTFVDSDHEIEERTGVSVSHIFDVEGEAGFRQRETQAIDELTRQQNLVLATGGGAVLKQENRKYLMERGFVVYLRASLDTLVERTSKDKNRPLLQTADPRARLEALLMERDPIYQQVADAVVDTDDNNIKSTVQMIQNLLKNES